ncbi:MAG TPA: hypothetical protein VFU41_15935 [Gemmatimonadales bacterium]|nr:hypothetical protein [Gemmatimonadales bacterium]
MTQPPRILGRSRRLLVVLPAVVVLACRDTPVTPGGGTPTGFARAYGIWTPGAGDDCSAAVHDGYSVVGPDGKLYPTWHPPVDVATGCSFGHDHGRDPRGSALYAQVGPIPFGYANEQLDIYDPANPRHEDHVGHKVEWEDGVRLHFGSAAADELFEIRCDVLTKLHQGTHSKDAFTNNLHELVYHIRCTDRTELHVTILAAIGDPGRFTRSCDGAEVFVGQAVPASSPAGGGHRRIADRFCVDQDILVPLGQRSNFGTLHESWETSNTIRREDGHGLAHFNPYFQVSRPSRFYDPASATLVGRPIDVCYEVTPSGERAQGSGGACDVSTAGGILSGLTFDDPRSVFDGVDRVVDVNSNIIDNAGGPAVWHTDPFGRHGRTEPFPGSIRQIIARMDNTRGGLDASGPTLGRERDYGGPRVHAPN